MAILNTYTFTLRVTDSDGNTAESEQTVVVNIDDFGAFSWVVLPNDGGS